MDREKDSAFLYEAFISLGLIFRKSKTDERAGQSANGAAYSDSRQSSDDRPCVR